MEEKIKYRIQCYDDYHYFDTLEAAEEKRLDGNKNYAKDYCDTTIEKDEILKIDVNNACDNPGCNRPGVNHVCKKKVGCKGFVQYRIS